MSVVVTLTPIEHQLAYVAGNRRYDESVSRGRKDAHGLNSDRDGLAIHVLGAAGELAFAKWRGLYWGGHCNSFKGPDLGANIQVRTRSLHRYDLIVRRDDDPDSVFVLVTSESSLEYHLHGWCWGKEAMKDEFLAKHGGREQCWFVPKGALRDFRKGKENQSQVDKAA